MSNSELQTVCIIKHKGDEIEIAILSLNRFDGDKKCNTRSSILLGNVLHFKCTWNSFMKGWKLLKETAPLSKSKWKI
jgi:hypothetical protein